MSDLKELRAQIERGEWCFTKDTQRALIECAEALTLFADAHVRDYPKCTCTEYHKARASLTKLVRAP
jgi:hypothetical protein